MNRLITCVCLSIILLGCSQQGQKQGDTDKKEVTEVLLTSKKYDNELIIPPPLEKYRTDRDICRFCIDENGVIYGVGVNPEVEVVRYYHGL